MRLAAIHMSETCATGAKGDVITVDIASAKAVAMAKPLLEAECVPLLQGQGRILARDVRASIDLPPFDNAAMDGFAIRRNDLKGTGPWMLPIRGRVAAGDAKPDNGKVDNAVRIFTGAAVPQGFDAVVMQERCERVGEQMIVIRERPRESEHIRRTGEDVSAGMSILAAGTLLAPTRRLVPARYTIRTGS